MTNFSMYITGIVNLGLVNFLFFFKFMLKLFVLRHGTAVNPGSEPRDFDRKLNKKGTAPVNQIGYILKNDALKIDQVIVSGAKRTLETAEIVNYYLEIPLHYSNDDLYLASRETIQQFLVEQGEKKSILLVGHNFGLSGFVNHLTEGDLLLSTSMLVQINFNFDDWNKLGPGTGKIERVIEPQIHSF